MEHHKICKLEAIKRFTFIKVCYMKMTSKYLSGDGYSVVKNKSFKTPMLSLDWCDYSDAHIGVKGKISATGSNDVNKK